MPHCRTGAIGNQCDVLSHLLRLLNLLLFLYQYVFIPDIFQEICKCRGGFFRPESYEFIRKREETFKFLYHIYDLDSLVETLSCLMTRDLDFFHFATKNLLEKANMVLKIQNLITSNGKNCLKILPHKFL